MKLRYPPSKKLLAFFLVGGSVAVYLLVAEGLALIHGHPQELLGFVMSIYIAFWVIVSSSWNLVEIRKRQKSELERKRDAELGRYSD